MDPVPRRLCVVLFALVLVTPPLAGCTGSGPDENRTGSDDSDPSDDLDTPTDDENDSETPSNDTTPDPAVVREQPADKAAPDGNLTIHHVDVGQGDGLVLHFPDTTVVYDAGRWSGDGETAVRDHLQAEGVTEVHGLIISHPDADHSGGCEEILTAFEVRYVFHPGIASDTQTWRDCTDAIAAEGAPEHTDQILDPGHYLNLSAYASAQVLHVDASASDPNAGSLALRVDYGDFELDLTGDATCRNEDQMLDRGFGQDVELLKVAHHGSDTSTCDPWLGATAPELGLIGVGADNRYGHPTDEVLTRLTDHGVDIYRTDRHGTITVTTDGSGWSVSTETGDGPYEHSSDDGTQTSGLNVTATVSDPEPCQYSDVTVSIAVEDEDGNPVEGANTTSTWNYKTTSPQEHGTTDANGEDAHTRDIGGASAGYEVTVDLDVEHNVATGEASTSFTPQDC